MVMSIGSDRNTSMFPAYDWDYSAFREGRKRDFRVTPRPRWITTEFGGHVREQYITLCLLLLLRKKVLITSTCVPPRWRTLIG
ncbi:hypothetical protein V6N13_126912 [Hibiscus sabdariffa]